MVKWQRDPDLKPGEVMHYARGYCTNCRSAYAVEKSNAVEDATPSIYGHGRQRSRLDKPDAEPLTNTPQTTQMELF